MIFVDQNFELLQSPLMHGPLESIWYYYICVDGDEHICITAKKTELYFSNTLETKCMCGMCRESPD